MLRALTQIQGVICTCQRCGSCVELGASALMDPSRIKPRMLVVSDHGRSIVERLFAARGFVVVGVPPALAHRLDPPPELVVLDFLSPHAPRLLVHFAEVEPRPVLVGIDPTGDAAEFLDAAFSRPVDPARLFVRAVVLLGQRRDPTRQPRAIPGVIAVVDGNDLFERLKLTLAEHISPLNAGAILDQMLRALGSTPTTVTPIEIEAAIASGRLRAGLEPFVEGQRLEQVIAAFSVAARARIPD